MKKPSWCEKHFKIRRAVSELQNSSSHFNRTALYLSSNRMEDESDALLAKKYDVSFWLNLLNETFIQSPRVLLKG